MGVVVLVSWVSLAILAEIGVVADSALVADTLDVRQVVFVLAKRSITENAVMPVGTVERLGQGLVNGYEAVARMNELGALDAIGAVVPVWAVQAFMADTIDELVAAIADSRVADIPARLAEEVGQYGKNGLFGGGLECMAGMMTVLVADMAGQAKIVIVARAAGNKLLFWEDLDTAIASAGWLFVEGDGLLLVGECSGDFVAFLGLALGCDALGGTVYNASVLDETLNHPVVSSRAMDTQVDASGAEIVVAAITNSAMEVLIFHWLITAIAVDNPRGADIDTSRLGAERKVVITVSRDGLVEKVWFLV